MKNRVFRAIGDIDASLIAEADKGEKQKKGIDLRVVSALAACAAVVVIASAAYTALPLMPSKDVSNGYRAELYDSAEGFVPGQKTCSQDGESGTAESSHLAQMTTENTGETSVVAVEPTSHTTETGKNYADTSDATSAVATLATTPAIFFDKPYAKVMIYDTYIIFATEATNEILPYDAEKCFSAMMQSEYEVFYVQLYNGDMMFFDQLMTMLQREYDSGHEIMTIGLDFSVYDTGNTGDIVLAYTTGYPDDTTLCQTVCTVSSTAE